MNIEIIMPDLATTDSEVTFLRWLIPVGYEVGLGQALFEIETDKASMEVESVAAGILQATYALEGQRVAVGQVIALIVNTSVGTPLIKPPEKPLVQASILAPREVPQSSAKPSSMFARNKAKQSSPQTLALSSVQLEIASRLQKAKQTIPHFYLSLSANAEQIVNLRRESSELLWDAFFVQAVAKATLKYERMYFRFEGDKLSRSAGDAVGVAVDVDDQLYVIAIDKPLEKSLLEISRYIRKQQESIKQGDPAAKRMGNTFLTISNLGASGMESFAAIINPPEAAVLAIGKIAPVAHVDQGQVVVQQRVNLTLSVDHRAHNGKYAAAFLKQVVYELEGI